ncbi:MAG: cold shock domain-containing protein [Bacteroidales bacterium]|nr:cold shock domain-containing protein [Bacteroidales bacterium]
MGRSQETYSKKEVRNKKEKKRKEKAQKRMAKKDGEKSSFEDMIAYVDENGVISSTPPDPNKKSVINVEDIQIGVPVREHVEFDPVRKGTVAFFNESKGYGFIRDSETKENVFVHVNNLIEDIKEGNLVSFETQMGDKGLKAVLVRLVK